MFAHNPTLVVPAYNRPHALRRLLVSLDKADYAQPVRLVIVIDGGGEQETAVLQTAHQFPWPHGPKEIIHQPQNLGLIGNIFYCGDLTGKYGAIILLEDDLYVSPVFYHYASQALAAYANDDQIAGISLNALWFNGYSHHPFVPYLDDSDVFFMQIAWYQGQVYTARQWQLFREWRETAVSTNLEQVNYSLHEYFGKFPPDEWFPLKTRYLVATNRTYVFPRHSLSTNFGDAGTHFATSTPFFQVPLQMQQTKFRFQPLADSLAVYDSFHEILPDRLNRLTTRFADYDYTIDLNGTKSLANIRTPYVLTTRPSKRPLQQFGAQLRPLIANVSDNIPGNGISFSKTADLDWSRRATLTLEAQNHHYFSRGRQLPWRKRLQFALLRRWPKIGAR